MDKLVATSPNVETLALKLSELVNEILAKESVTQIAINEIADLPAIFSAVSGMPAEIASNLKGVLNSAALILADYAAKLLIKK